MVGKRRHPLGNELCTACPLGDICVCVYMYVCVCVCVYMRVPVRAGVCVCVHTFLSVRVHARVRACEGEKSRRRRPLHQRLITPAAAAGPADRASLKRWALKRACCRRSKHPTCKSGQDERLAPTQSGDCCEITEARPWTAGGGAQKAAGIYRLH